MTVHDHPIQLDLIEDDSLLVITLARPKANILDAAMVSAVRSAVQDAATARGLRAILFTGAGDHFSYGASVEEHRPAQAADMLAEFHALFRDLAAGGKVLLSAVRGFCLGGGLELAAYCQRVFAAPDARLGCPEIKLGVFAPIGSLILPLRCGQAAADGLLLTGRTASAAEALRLGLVDAVAQDPVDAARDWHRAHLLPLSAASLAHTVRAARVRLHRDLETLLPVLEADYLQRLMATRDAREGIAAFLDKRSPSWNHD